MDITIIANREKILYKKNVRHNMRECQIDACARNHPNTQTIFYEYSQIIIGIFTRSDQKVSNLGILS